MGKNVYEMKKLKTRPFANQISELLYLLYKSIQALMALMMMKLEWWFTIYANHKPKCDINLTGPFLLA